MINLIDVSVARETLEGHQRAIMGNMTVEEIYRDRKTFSSKVFEVATTDLVNMGMQVWSLKNQFYPVDFLHSRICVKSVFFTNN